MYIVIIPYRDRAVHLEYFRSYSVPLLKTHLDAKIVVAEQVPGKAFNRGMCINAAVKFAHEKYGKDCVFITQDVDVNPLEATVRDLYAGVPEGVDGVYTSFHGTLGGVVKFKYNAYQKANGFPNSLFGWGCEDKFFQNRVSFMKIPIKKNLLSNDPDIHKHFKIFNDVNDRDTTGHAERHHDAYIRWNRLSDQQKFDDLTNDGLSEIDAYMHYVKISEI